MSREHFEKREKEISETYMSAAGNNGNNKSTANQVLGGFTAGMLLFFGGMIYLVYKLSKENK